MHLLQRLLRPSTPRARTQEDHDAEQRLCTWAAQWRAAHAAGDWRGAERAALRYHDTVRALEWGDWTEDRLPADAQLPAAVRATSRAIDDGEHQ